MFFSLSIKFKDGKKINTKYIKRSTRSLSKGTVLRLNPVQTLNHKIKLEISICIFFMNSTTSLLHWKRGYINRIREEEDK